MNYLHCIVLYCLRQFRGERSLSAIYHLLKGKKSSQTLQDSKWFQLEFLFGVLKDIEKNDVNQTFRQLQEKRFIERINERHYQLTDLGNKYLDDWLTRLPFPAYLNGLKYHQQTKPFWYRLSLVIQTLSNLFHGRKFEPIHRDEETLAWVKRYLLSKKQIHDLGKRLYHELTAILSAFSDDEAAMFVLRLTSYERIGWTNEQIAVFFNKDRIYIQLTFQHMLHYMIARVEKERNRFPALYELLRDLYVPIPLTMSTRKTYEWLQKGKSIEQIARIRKLKRSTIEDHLVEIAANISDFSIEPFVERQTIEKIKQTAAQLQTNQLKKIKEALGAKVSYFEIRLVLAKVGGKRET
ncbi:MAG TPA: helix-turn-helix domain-containing protein [Anoxybacillus sp.]|nr:helix-turn-helix domain-containing protein [Anoxybacillus sp.]